MIVSYKVAKYLFNNLGYTKECKQEYWNGILHNSFDSYRPIENIIPAPDVLEALDWITSKAPYTIKLSYCDKRNIYYIIIKSDTDEYELSPFKKISDAIVSAIEYIAMKALES